MEKCLSIFIDVLFYRINNASKDGASHSKALIRDEPIFCGQLSLMSDPLAARLTNCMRSPHLCVHD
jgi:hypothetical protein